MVGDDSLENRKKTIKVSLELRSPGAIIFWFFSGGNSQRESYQHDASRSIELNSIRVDISVLVACVGGVLDSEGLHSGLSDGFEGPYADRCL